MDNEAAVVDAKSTNWDNGMCPTKEFAEKKSRYPQRPGIGGNTGFDRVEGKRKAPYAEAGIDAKAEPLPRP